MRILLAIIGLSLWVASHIFRGIKFSDTASLIVSVLLLGFANAVVKPLLIVLTLPLTLLTFGLFLLVINTLMILLVSSLVQGAGREDGAADAGRVIHVVAFVKACIPS